MHDDQFEFSLVDEELMAEVELLTQVIITASESDAPLTLVQIDAVLGLVRPADEPDPSEAPGPSEAPDPSAAAEA